MIGADPTERPREERKWAISNPGNAAIRAEIVRAALGAVEEPLRGPGAILDAGCGRGWWLRQLRGAGVTGDRLYGIDIDAPSVEAAARVAPEATLRVGDVRALPYDDDRFAVVFSMLVLSTLPSADDVRRAVAEFRRVLAPDGAFVVWDPRVWTSNPTTRIVRPGELGAGVESRAITLLPPLARRLGPTAPRLYRPLARVPLLRSHRLFVGRR